MKAIICSLLVSFLLFFSACSEEENGHRVVFEGDVSEHKWSLQDLNPELPSDWSQSNFLTFEYYSSSTQRFYVNLFDAEGTRTLRILPFQGAWVRASVPLGPFQVRPTQGHDMAAIGQSGMHAYGLGYTGSVGSISNIDSMGVLMGAPTGYVGPPIDSPSLEIRNVRLTMEPEDSVLSPLPLVDKFGQWIPADWSGKAGTIEELRSAWDQEDRELKSGNFHWSKYGGDLNNGVRATGFFRVEQINDRWWFVDPEGYLFYSLGSTGIGPGGSFARVEGREYMFEEFVPEELSQKDSRLGRHSFFAHNVYHRFGDDYHQKWIDFTARRMEDWGFNTIANWSDRTFGTSGRKPYVATLGSWRFDPRTMGMPDVYASDYADFVDEAARRQCAPLKDDPYLLGYFVGNEPPWPGRELELARVIMEGPETPMQKALKEYLADGDTPERRRSFVYDTYTKFINLVNDAIKRHDPNHLNLGLRFGGSPPEDLIKASAGFDVFSLNIYGYTAYADRLDRIAELTGLPIIIGEFHFGVPGRGLSPGLRQATNQEERGVAYRYYVEQAAAHPNMVGTHWFQWWDQPATGRGDGENYNIGLVDVTDRPYRELIDAARETHKRIYDVHSGRIPPVSRQAVTH